MLSKGTFATSPRPSQEPASSSSRAKEAPRVGDVRVFYDVAEGQVRIVAIVPNDGAEDWLRKAGG